MTFTSKKLAAAVLAITVAMSLSACSNWSKRDVTPRLVPVLVRLVVQY